MEKDEIYIAIDDSYGPEDGQRSKYVTGARRTYVAVEFPDYQVEEVRRSIKDCLNAFPELINISPKEFHFTDIYNRRGAWRAVKSGENLRIFEFFAEIYLRYQWRVHIQTVDERTLRDHSLKMSGVIDGIDISERDGQALLFLLLKIKKSISLQAGKLNIRIDSGRSKLGAIFAKNIFHEWGKDYEVLFENSHAEPLIQIADFFRIQH